MMTARNDMLRRIHAAARAMGLDDDAYRDVLERVAGKRSAKDCSDEELPRVLSALRVNYRPTSHAHHGLIKALFIAAYNLGQFDQGTDARLDAFVERQTGKVRLTFVTPAEAASITEALKAMLARDHYIVPDLSDGGVQARRDLVRAQWCKLHKLGAVVVVQGWALDRWVSERYLNGAAATVDQLDKAQLDRAARDLGAWIRRVQAKQKKVA